MDFYSQHAAHLLKSSFPFSYKVNRAAAPKSKFLCSPLSQFLPIFFFLPTWFCSKFLDLFFSLCVRLSALRNRNKLFQVPFNSISPCWSTQQKSASKQQQIILPLEEKQKSSANTHMLALYSPSQFLLRVDQFGKLEIPWMSTFTWETPY